MRRLILLLTLFLFITKPLLFAQDVDSVDKKLDSISDINLKIEFLNEWTGKNYRKFPVEAIHYAEKTIKYADESKNYSGAGNALIRIGLVHFRKLEYTQSISFFDKAIDKFKISNDSIGISNTNLNRGIVYRNMNKYNLAIADFFACIKYYEKHSVTYPLFLSYNSIGILYKDLKEYNKALEYYNKAKNLYLEGNKIPLQYTSNTNIANILSIQNKFQEALKHYKNNLEILKTKPNNFKQAQTYHNIGSCFIEMEQYSLALEYLNQSLEIKEKIGSEKLIITTLNGLSQSNYLLGNLADALKYSKRALQLGKKIENIECQKTSTENILRIFTDQNMADSAIHYFGIHEELRDSILNTETLKQIAEIQEKYEAEKKEVQITLLEKENKSRMMQRNWLVILAILLFGFAIFMIRSYFIHKKINRLLHIQKTRIEWHTSILDKKNIELSESNSTKNRLFQIISHDLRSPLASVYNISQLIKIFIKQKKFDLLEESSKDMEECVNSVLNLTDNLLSWSLNQSGKLPYNPVIVSLKPLLNASIKTFYSAAKQKSIHLQLVLENEFFVFADRQMLDTVVRNLINNSLKFTLPGGIIAIGAKQNDGFIEIWIKDSGIGISEDQIPNLFEIDSSKSHLGTVGEKGNGLGLVLCKQFIEQNNGEIWVESILNKGTTFRFTIPCGENTEKIGAVIDSKKSKI